MKYQVFFILALLLISSQAKEDKCSFAQKNLQEQGKALFEAYETQDFETVVANTLYLNQFVDILGQDCPVIYNESQKFTYTESSKCYENIPRLQELLKSDMVSSFQEIKDILLFQSSECLPFDYTPQGFENYLNNFKNEEKDVSPKQCMGCSFIFTAIINYIEVNKLDITKFIGEKGICKLFPGLIRTSCNKFFDKYGPVIIEALVKGENSDQVCDALGFCSQWPQCRLHSESTPQPRPSFMTNTAPETLPNVFLPSWLQKIIDTVVKKHLPIDDIDGDRFSTRPTLRGTDWRGKDCAPFNSYIYPGRKKSYGKKGTDYNCNGIHGHDSETGVPFKHKYCENSGQMGSITIGDSAGAHFSLPAKYFNSTLWHKNTFNDLIPRLMNEFDLPMESGGTGFEPQTNGNSFYLKLLNRNRCNRNDYQNLGVNGASSKNDMDDMIAIARNKKTDFPVLVFWELVGNDVCGSSADLKDMTSPEEFKQNILKLWYKLDTILPKGSHMVVNGLVDGRVLFACLKDREQPLGVPYPQFYDYMNCMHSSPCAGWMNTNAEIRNRTTDRAKELNKVYQELIQENTFQNFDIQYYDFPIEQIIQTIIDNGGKCWDAIEPTDGFHPSSQAEQLWAEIQWEKLKKDHPDWLGPINPNNEIIDQLFPDSSIPDNIETEELIELL